jgi:3-(3-hydroxy-phenyl)propionate hydroxylase
MRVFQTLGLADAVAAETRVNPGMKFVNADGKLMLDWSRPMEIGPNGWPASFRFHQPALERTLREGVRQFPSVAVRLGVEVVGLAEEVGVALRLASGETLRARYVVGCDGGRSFSKAAIGGGDEDLGFRERWLVTDLILKRPMPELGDYSVQHCDPRNPATYVRGVGDRRRWEIALKPGEDAAEATRPAKVWDKLARFVTPADATLERAAVYTFHSTIARVWRKGRVMIAGDAAHQTPPFLGQGMCAGIRDAANLGWRLARAARGGSEALLDAYQAERAPHVREYIDLAVRIGRLINATATGAMVDEAAARGEAPRKMDSIRPKLGGFAGAHPLAGTLAPQPVLADGARLDDRIGWRPALLASPNVAAPKGALVISDPSVTDWLAANGAAAALIRPDRYVQAVAESKAQIETLERAISLAGG